MMWFFQCRLILFGVLLINFSSSSTISNELTSVKSIYKEAVSEIQKLENELKKDQEQLSKTVQNLDVIQLNVGGELMMTTRQTLTCIPESTLASIFSGRWDDRLPTDQNGNIFLDFNPKLFRYLLDQLQIFDVNHSTHIDLPSEPSLIYPFKKMLKKLGLHQLVSSSEKKDIMTFNVGGQMLTNRRSTFTQIPNSTFNATVLSSITTNSDVFLDYHPNLFQHLIEQLREVSSKDISSLKAPSSRETKSFKRMLADLNFTRQSHSSINIDHTTRWIQNGSTVAGGHGKGDGLGQLDWPESIFIDDDEQKIYISDSDNHRIVEWLFDAHLGQVVAGGNGQGNRIDQLDYPTDVIVDKKNDSLIICDCRNRRVVRWSRQDDTHGQTIIFDIDCYGLGLDNTGDLYVSDLVRNEVRRWKIGDTNGVLVAGGNGEGNQLNQLYLPTGIFVDQNHSVYVSDEKNHRVMKWMKDAKKGLIVAGGHGQGDNLAQLSYPRGVIVDHSGNIYVADSRNNRIIRWVRGADEGSIVVGGNGQGKLPNQFHYPKGLSFDRQGHLYVADWDNNRVQQFDVDIN